MPVFEFKYKIMHGGFENSIALTMHDIEDDRLTTYVIKKYTKTDILRLTDSYTNYGCCGKYKPRVFFIGIRRI